VTGVETCALPISQNAVDKLNTAVHSRHTATLSEN